MYLKGEIERKEEKFGRLQKKLNFFSRRFSKCHGWKKREILELCIKCVDKDPNKRPSAQELKKHAWIAKNENLHADVAKWIQEHNLMIEVPEY